MGTNLLNLSPSSQTSELVVVPGYGYYGWPFCADAACALSLLFDPYLPLQLFTAVTSGSPFEILADSFREEVALSPCCFPILRCSCFQGTPLVLRRRFPSKTSCGLRHFPLSL